MYNWKFWLGLLVGVLLIGAIVAVCAVVGAQAHGWTAQEFFAKLVEWIAYNPTVKAPL